MNADQMTILAADRRRELLAEAQRARRARSARNVVTGRGTSVPVRRTRSLGLGLLFGRPSA
jgi:hypothetical protein